MSGWLELASELHGKACILHMYVMLFRTIVWTAVAVSCLDLYNIVAIVDRFFENIGVREILALRDARIPQKPLTSRSILSRIVCASREKTAKEKNEGTTG